VTRRIEEDMLNSN